MLTRDSALSDCSCTGTTLSDLIACAKQWPASTAADAKEIIPRWGASLARPRQRGEAHDSQTRRLAYEAALPR
eukprot:9488965-Pyramimonas_sp.AAC.2